MAFAEEGSPAFFAGAFDVVQSTYLDEPKVAEAFRTGKGVGWHEHSKCLFSGTERFFRPGYNANLVSNWIPTLERRRSETESWRQGGRCRMRPRGLYDCDGTGLPQFGVLRIRLPQAFD
jgi:hypothetical protein